ncbi:thioredoxin [Maribacter flavus]|uniref:Thioredoxin n=1 Tax=Maribacter flavus TaxID=1658664 RepID=A0A5B2TUN4_9FLAO|nr:thioredoxin [Maribacter flavus]KAA2217400.1 thioredoxin [Maribacter flavus]
MSNFSELIKGDKPVLVDFYATWCGPCQLMHPILDDVKKEVGENASILKIDVDKNQELAAKYQVRGVPTLMIFKDGEQLFRQSGVLQKKELVKLLEENA